MNKNIIVFNSKENFLEPLFEELKKRNYNFIFLDSIFRDANTFLGKVAFLIVLPLLRMIYFFYFLFLNHKYKFEAAILFNLNEKLIFSPLVRVLKKKIIWVELPENDFKMKKFFKRLYRMNAKVAKIIVFNEYGKIKLQNLGVKTENIEIVQPGIKLNQNQYQENIFSGLVREETKIKNFFTVGTVIDAGREHNLDTLLQAIKICAEIIPNIQLIVVSNVPDKKNLNWSAKKMGIDNLVWFVGGEKYSRRWYDNFEIFIVGNKVLNLRDLEIVLRSMRAGLPVIGPVNRGLEDIVYENKTGSLIEAQNSEMLARQIIKLYQDRRLRLRLGQIAKERVKEFFTIENQIEKFEELLLNG